MFGGDKEGIGEEGEFPTICENIGNIRILRYLTPEELDRREEMKKWYEDDDDEKSTKDQADYVDEDEIDDFVRKKIRSYSRMIAEGSREWDIMYDKLFEEEKAKRGGLN